MSMTEDLAGQVLSIHSGRPAPLREGKSSAIRKGAVEGVLALGAEGLEGDVQVDRRYHGGPFKALCVYPSEYYPGWRALTGRDMAIGSFGENFSTEGMLDEAVCVGDIYEYGGTRLQVTAPRAPCGNLSTLWQTPGFHLQVKKERKTGFYLRVLEGGMIAAGERLVLRERTHATWTLPRFWDVLDGVEASREELESLLAEPALDPMWAKGLRSRLERPSTK